MAQPLDDTIPVPLGSGVTDHPEVVQHGMPGRGVSSAAAPAAAPEGTVDLSEHFKGMAGTRAAKPVPSNVPSSGDTVDLSEHFKPKPIAPIAKPTLGQVLTQPTEQTDKDYMGYTGPAGVAGATIHGMSNVARDTTGALKSMYHMVVDPATAEEQARDKAQGSESTSPLGRAGMVAERAIRGMVVDPAKQLYQNSTKAGLAEQNAAIKDINASPDPMAHYAQAAEDTASQGAGQALTAIGMEAAHEVPGEVKTNLPVIKQVATAPVRLASRAAGHVLPAAPIVGEMAGGFPGRMAAHALRGGIADIVEHGKTVGLPELEKKAVTLEGRAADATKAQVKAQAQADLYTASHVPESVDKALTKANEAATDAKMHAEAAREAANADKAARKAPAGPPAAQITAKQPEAPAAAPVAMAKPVPQGQAVLPKMAAGDVGIPRAPEPAPAPYSTGPRQPETFPQQPTPAPMVRPGEKLPGGEPIGRRRLLNPQPLNMDEGVGRQEILPPEPKPKAPVAAKEPTTIEMGPGKLATPEPEAKAAPTTPAVKPEDLKTQIERSLGNKQVEPGVKMGEQHRAAAEPAAETPKAAAEPKVPAAEEPKKVSSDKRRNVLRDAGATPEEEATILYKGAKPGQTGPTRVEMSKLADHFGVKVETEAGADASGAIGRAKGDITAGTHVPPHELLQRIIDAGHTPAEIAAAIDEGKHLQSVSGGSQGADAEGAFKPVDHDEYAKAVKENPQSATLTDPAETTNNKTFSNGKGVYYSISPEGDLQGVINNSGEKGALKSVMPHAIANGAKTLDAWDIYLPKQYEKYGFERTESIPYDTKAYGEPSQALKDAWKQQGWKEGDPYPAVQHMKLKEGAAEKPAYAGEERRATRRAPMNAAETEEAMKNRKPVNNPFNDTEGAMATINKDLEAKGLGTPKAEGTKGAVQEIDSKFPLNPDNKGAGTVPKEYAIMKDGKPEATFTVSEREGKLRLKGIQSVDPRTGAGSRALKTLTDIADKHNVPMELTASPYGDEASRLNGDQLKEWYGRHGFVPEKGTDPALGYMTREPKAAAAKYAAPDKGVPETALAKGPEAEKLQAADVASSKLAKEWDEASKEKPKATGYSQKADLRYPARPKATMATAKMSDADLLKEGFTKEDIDAGKHLPSVGGGSGKGKLPTGDELVDKYGESSGDPAHTAFILKDGRGVDLPAGVEHDAMLGGKPTDNLREQFIADGNIRLRPRSGRGGREVALSIPESGVSDKQLDYLKKMAPQLKSGTVVIEVGKPDGGHTTIPYGEATPEALEKAIKGLAPAEAPLTAKQEAKVGKLADEIEAKVKEGAFDPLSEEHLTAEEKAGLSKSGIARRNYADNMAKLPPLQELVDFAKGGEGARKWYERSRAAFKALHEEAPRYFQPDDGERWANFTASLSPRQMVHKNLAEAIHAWTQWTDDGRPMDDAGIKDSLGQAIKAAPKAKIPNATKALQGTEMWPDLTKNRNFKVPSFGMNLSPAENLAKAKAFANAVTNDGWQALVHGVDEGTISSPSSYHPLSVMARAVAKELGWEPEEAQAAMWSFAQALKERGEADPQYVREYSQDFADIMSQDKNIRKQMQSLGVDLGKLDTKLKAIGEKPEVTPGASPTTEHSTRQLKERIEVARGKGSVPEPKQQSRFYFKEPSATEGRTRVPDEEEGDTSFDPEQFRTQTNEPVMEKLGKKKSPMRKMGQ